MLVIGDVHGKITEYLKKINSTEDNTFQVGDMGIGFHNSQLPKLAEKDLFIRGNHDKPALCKIHPNYAGEYGYGPTLKLFYAGGAWSIDKEFRKEYESQTGVSIWWPDEELDVTQRENCYRMYVASKPEIVITHDAPDKAGEYVLKSLTIGGNYYGKIATDTGTLLQKMFSFHQPKLWIFGHYHVDRAFEMEGTKFVCLNELSTFSF